MSCQPAWMRRVQVGHVVRFRGRLRVVRNVSRKPDGSLHMLMFAIKSCSWTGRPYTLCTASDLKTAGAVLTRAKRRRLTSAADRALLRTYDEFYRIGRPYSLSCCAAKDMP